MIHRRPKASCRFRAWSAHLALLILMATGGTASELPAGTSVAIPLDMVGGRPQVEVLINGEGPYAFVLDTGAGVSVLDTGIARELGLEVVGEEEIGAPGMEQVPAEVVMADELRVHEWQLSDERLVTMEIAGRTGGRFVGVLRFGVFANALATMDLSAGALLLSHGSLDPASVDVIAYQDDDGLIDIPISIGDREFMAHLDTGSPGRFTLPGKVAEELSFLEEPTPSGHAKLVGGQGAMSKGQLNEDLAVGHLRFQTPEVTILDLPIPNVNLGSRFLADHIVRIDQTSRLIQFEPLAAHRAPSSTVSAPKERVVSSRTAIPSGGRRLGLRPAPGPPGPNGLPLVDGGLLVAGVDPGSLAAEAGLGEGDVVLTVNGTSLLDFDMTSLAALFRGSEPLQMKVRRAEDGDVEQVEIP